MGLLGSLGSAIGSLFGFGSASKPGANAVAAKPTEPVGVSGFAIFGGFPSIVEQNPELNGTRRYTTYKNAFLNLPIAAKGYRLYLDLGSGAQWSSKPADDSTQAQKYADQLDEIRNARGGRPWRQIVRHQLKFYVEDFAIQAWAARKIASGLWGLDVQARPNHTVWRWDADPLTGEFRGVEQLSPQTGTPFYIPRERMIYSVDSTFTDSPVGLGIARHIVEVSERITRYRQLEGQGFESDLAGMPIIRAPYNALTKMIGTTMGSGAGAKEFTAADRDKIIGDLLTFLKAHQKNPSRGILLDSETYVDNDGNPSTVKKYDFETARADTAESQKAIAAAIEREEHRAAVMMDAEQLLLSGTRNAGGNKAVSGDKSERVAANVNGRLEEVADALNADYVSVIGTLNGWPEKLWPKLVPADVTPLDVEAMSRILANLTTAMLEPDDEAIDFVRAEAGIPAAPERSLATAAADASLRGKPAPKPGGAPPDDPMLSAQAQRGAA